jgi:ribosomal protein L1, bacterial/chloroplast
MKKKSFRYKNLKETYKKKELKKFEQILNELKNGSGVKFDESIDISMKINLKKIKGSDNNLRTLIDLPHGNGKKVIVGLLCDENKLDEAKKSGADVVGSEDLLKKISDKNINFDKLICTPSMMSKIGKLGKILGPKGLMPNPKMGTVSDDLAKSVDKIKNKSIEVKNDKDGNFSFSIGRKSFQENKLLDNLKSAFEFLKKEKSSIFNSENIKKVYFSTTMSPSFKLNFKDI